MRQAITYFTLLAAKSIAVAMAVLGLSFTFGHLLSKLFQP